MKFRGNMVVGVSIIILSLFILNNNAKSDSLVGYWRFDEGTGTTAYDTGTTTSTSMYDGTIYGSQTVGTLWSPGIKSTALVFDGNDDYVLIPDPADGALDFTDELTISAWLLRMGTATMGLVAKDYNSYQTFILPTGKLRFQPDGNFDSTNALVNNQVYHVALTFDNATTTPTKKWYINGAEDASASISSGLSLTNDYLKIGARLNGTTTVDFFLGGMDDVRIYNRALSADEIAELYNIEGVFYVDSNSGDDSNNGALSSPFRSLNKALEIVSNRVNLGITSDRIYLRAGKYRNDGFNDGTGTANRNFTLYNLNLKGTAENPSILSAMPCDPDVTSGCIQRKSGGWYEKVVIDDGMEIASASGWNKVVGTLTTTYWEIDPGYNHYNWGTAGTTTPPTHGTGISWMSGANEHQLAIGPRMVLQDGVPLKWVDPWPDYVPNTGTYTVTPTVDIDQVLSSSAGLRTYDQVAGKLYVRPIDDIDLDTTTVLFESWKGTSTDSRFRHTFEGDIVHTEIKGIEFRLITSIFNGEKQFENMNDVLWEDNLFSYCWKHLFDDEVPSDIESVTRENWTIRNNVFYRPSREVFQTWGDNHVFEYNEVIEHSGPWAGGAAMVSLMNLRHMNNSIIRHNYLNHSDNIWASGAAIMFEVDTAECEEPEVDYDWKWSGSTIENNFIGMFDEGGVAIQLGQSGCNMHDITIRNNVFAFIPNPNGTATSNLVGIFLTSPYTNLKISNNVFHDVDYPFGVWPARSGYYFGTETSSGITISDNIFSENNKVQGGVISDIIVNDSGVAIDHNLFFGNSGTSPIGSNTITGDPLFTGTSTLNFTIGSSTSPAIVDGLDIGAYDYGTITAGTEWWNIDEGTSTGYVFSIFDEGKIAHWNFENGTGTSVFDSSYNNNFGTMTTAGGTNTASWSVGKKCIGLEFDGVDDYVEIAEDDSDFDITESMSIAAWIRPTFTGSNMGVVAKDHGSYQIFLYPQGSSNGKLRYQPNNFDSNITIDSGKWYHIVYAYDYNGGNGVHKWYVNGVEDNSESYTSVAGTNDTPLKIGARGTTPVDFFKGKIDDVQVYNRALSAEEVVSIYNNVICD